MCEDGHRRLHHLMAPSQETFPEACRCLAEDAETSFNHRKVPTRHRQSVRTSHLVERACEEERRRTKVIPHRWDEASTVLIWSPRRVMRPWPASTVVAAR